MHVLNFGSRQAAFSRAQVLFVLCVALIAFEVGSRMAENKAPVKPAVRKTNILAAAPVPEMTRTELNKAEPDQPTNEMMIVTNAPVPTNARVVARPAPTAAPRNQGRQYGGGQMAPGMKVDPPTRDVKLPRVDNRLPTNAAALQPGFGVRIALP